ncbi:LapA family protein [Thauera aromatica]|nr:LapA family protein [Thauera aromatica]MCK2095080.1 LapA family protein [Thauera aromatica]
MRAIIWSIRLLLFFLLFGFAIKNDHLATLNFYFGGQWQLPLVFVILLSFAAGALLGVTATLASLIRQRREISRLRRQLERAERDRSDSPASASAPASAPAGDSRLSTS